MDIAVKLSRTLVEEGKVIHLIAPFINQLTLFDAYEVEMGQNQVYECIRSEKFGVVIAEEIHRFVKQVVQHLLAYLIF